MKCQYTDLSKAPVCQPCDYVRPAVRFVLVKVTKKGIVKVKINGEGKWIGATYDKVNQIVSFYS